MLLARHGVVHLLIAGMAACLGCGEVIAQETAASPPTADSSGALTEIIVTAQKRTENIQHVPLAVTAVSGAELNQQNIQNVGSLVQLIPNAGFNSAEGETRIAIRGITFDNIMATGAEARVAYHQDGIYLSRSGNINGTFFDVDRVEVLRGPQGTLFGRNAIAGAVNLVTRDPTNTFEGYLQTDAGNYDSLVVQGALSGPITDGVSFRIAGRTSDHNGYGYNLTNDIPVDNLHQRDLRTKLKIEPNDAIKLVLSGDFTRRDDSSGYYFGGFLVPGTMLPGDGLTSQAGNLRNGYQDGSPHTYNEFFGVAADLEWNLGNGYALTSITSWRHGHESVNGDSDGTSEPLLSPARFGDIAKQFSEELRLQKSFERGNWMVGAYNFDEDYTGATHVPLNVVLFGGPDFVSDGVRYGGVQRTRAFAAFAQGTYDILNDLRFTLGGRYSEDRKELVNEYDVANTGIPADLGALCNQPCDNLFNLPPGTPFLSAKKSWHNFSPKATVQYDFDSLRNVYLTFSKGFKSGGFNLGLDNFGNGFNPETLTDYEAGFKGDFLDRRLRFDAAAFYYDYKNLQVFQDLSQEIGAVLVNAAAAKLYGVEVEIKAEPVPNLLLNLAASGMKSKFTNFVTGNPALPNGPHGDQPGYLFNLAGNRLPSAPTYTASYGIQYTWPVSIGGITLRGEGNSISQVYFDQYNEKTVSAAGYTNLNAFLSCESTDRRYFGSLYARNITDVFRIAGATLGNGFSGFNIQTSFIPPRTFGATFGVRFQ